MKFKSGEPVICIDDSFTWARQTYRSFNLTFPVCGRCYVVRGYVIKGSHPAITLQGISNVQVPYLDGKFREAGFWEERFARAPDISDLRKIADQASCWLPAGIVQDENEKEDA